MMHTTKKTARILIATVAAAALLSIGSATAFAGEITGNGRLLDMHGKSACSFSGQEDLQWYVDQEDQQLRSDPTRGDPGHAQSWGQIDHATRDFLTSIGYNPGIACNPTKSSGEG